MRLMIHIFCREAHGSGSGDLCDECSALQEYADRRLDRCPLQERKTTCARCTAHCYSPEMRERVKRVMRTAGPKMTWRHPVLALLHFVDGLRTPAGS